MKDRYSKSSGVYKIINRINGKFYIGSTSMPFSRRFDFHECELKHGRHGNIHLQRSYDKHGRDAFTFEIVEECSDKSILRHREQFYIDSLNPEFNIQKDAVRSGFGIRKPVIRSDGKRFDDTYQAAEEMKVKPNSITKVILDPNRTIKGFRFKYEGTDTSLVKPDKVQDPMRGITLTKAGTYQVRVRFKDRKLYKGSIATLEEAIAFRDSSK